MDSAPLCAKKKQKFYAHGEKSCLSVILNTNVSRLFLATQKKKPFARKDFF